jgi:hypothetical protein
VLLLDYLMALLQLMRLYGLRCGVDWGGVFHNVLFSLCTPCVALCSNSKNILIIILKKEVGSSSEVTVIFIIFDTENE